MKTCCGLLAGALVTISLATIAAAPVTANIRVEHPWIRWLPANLPNAGYATIVNAGDNARRLAGASSPDYGSVILMQSRLAEDDSSMVRVKHIDIPAHASASLAPGGYHIMLSHASKSIRPGDRVPVTLHFADGAAVQVDFPVLPANASGPAD